MKENLKATKHHIDVSPLASHETQRVAQSSNIALAIYDAIRSGFSPGPNRPKTWYGRAFLFFGTILVVLVFGAVVVVQVLELLHGRHPGRALSISDLVALLV
jgi:hypothetical protein